MMLQRSKAAPYYDDASSLYYVRTSANEDMGHLFTEAENLHRF